MVFFSWMSQALYATMYVNENMMFITLMSMEHLKHKSQRCVAILALLFSLIKEAIN